MNDQIQDTRQSKSVIVETVARPLRLSHRRRVVLATMVTILLIVAWIVLNFGFSMPWFGNDDSARAADTDVIRKLPVRVQPVEFVNQISQNRLYTGIIRAKQQASLGFELTGRIEIVACDEGDIVQQGQILAALDIQALTAKKEAMNASLSQATAIFQELLAGPRPQTIESMRAQMEEATSNLKLAELNYQRRNKIRAAIAEEELDRAQYSYKSALSRVGSISKQLEELEAGTRPERIAAQRAAVDQLKSALHEIDVQIEKSSIVAPFSGKIVQRMADPGSIATASTEILKIVDLENMEAVIGIPVDTAQQMKTGNSYSVNVSSKSYPAQLIAKIQQLETATRTQNLIFELDSTATGNVIPGQLCQIEIATEIVADGYWVPASALTNGIRGLWSLLVIDIDRSRASRTDVQIVYTDGERALVKGALNEGTLIIVEGTHRIVEGQLVEAIFEQANR